MLITKSLEDREIVLKTFVDFEGAFNNATTNTITEALRRRCLTSKLLH